MLFTEEEKAEAREFEEDQVAGRLKEDVVRVAGWCWEEGLGLLWLVEPHACPLPAAGAEGQAAEVGGEGGEWAARLCKIGGDWGPSWVGGRWLSRGLRLWGL